MKKFIALIIILLVIIFFGLQILKAMNNVPIPSMDIAQITTPTTTIFSGPVILNAIRNEANLETISMVFANDLDITKTWGLEGACRETLTYLGYYTVTAGVDLQAISNENVKVDNGGSAAETEITITLPPAKILHIELDTQRSRVVHNEVSILSQICGTRLGEMVMEAQSRTQNLAETAANQQEILKQAEDRASFELKKILLTMGFPKVNIVYDSSYSQQ